MTIRSYDINLDSFNATIPEPIVGRQGDKNGAVMLHVTITDGGAPVNLSGEVINLIAETANGTAVIADNDGVTLTDAINGKFDYAIPNALWSEPGKITKAYFSLNDNDGGQTTYDLIFIVKNAIDISQNKADDYVTIIDGTLRELTEKVQAINDAYNNGAFYNKSESDSRYIKQLDGYAAVNLAPFSGYPTSTYGWQLTGPGASDSSTSFTTSTSPYYHSGIDNLFSINTSSSSESFITGNNFGVVPGEKLSWSLKSVASSNVSSIDAYIIFDKSTVKIVNSATNNKNTLATYNGTAIVPSGCTTAYFRFDNNGSSDGSQCSAMFTEAKIAREPFPSPWSIPAGNVVISKGTMYSSANFYKAGTSSSKDALTYSISGKTMTINGVVAPVNDITTSAGANLATIPKSIAVLDQPTAVVLAGAGTNIFTLSCDANGNMNVLKYQSGGTYATIPKGTSLNINISLVIS
jgi:hypothetical protein